MIERYPELHSSLEKVSYPWIIISKTNEGQVYNVENRQEIESRKAFYETWFSGIKGPEDFFGCPVSYYLEKRVDGLKIIEEIPAVMTNVYGVNNEEDGREQIKTAITLTSEQIKGLIKKEYQLNLAIYKIDKKIFPSDLIKFL